LQESWPTRMQIENIEGYLRALPPALLDLESIDTVEIFEMMPGSYNLNFHVKVNKKEFVFRINIEPQSGLSQQIKYEFKVLKFLQNHRLAPKAYHFDDNLQYFDFAILIEEYLEGPYLTLENDDVSKAVDLMVRLHSIKPNALTFVVSKDPLLDTFELARNDLIHYESKKSARKKIIRLAHQLLTKNEAALTKHRHLFQAESLNHTDVGCDNFIKTAEGLKLIDWEKPRVDDCSYDIGCFLSETVQKWCSRKVLNLKDRIKFVIDYAHLSGKDSDLIIEKVNLREPLISLHWILWGATKLCDLEDHQTSSSLLESHEEKRARFERIADPENIEKLLVAKLLY
jgi:thiamine kinase-like enzyme